MSSSCDASKKRRQPQRGCKVNDSGANFALIRVKRVKLLPTTRQKEFVRRSTDSNGDVCLECQLCLDTFTTDEEAKRHIAIIHRLNGKLKCPLCSYSTDDLPSSLRHSGERHRDADAKFINVLRQISRDIVSSDDEIEGDDRNNKATQYRCIFCDSVVKYGYRQILKHIKVHLKYQPYKCKACCQEFVQKRQVIAHIDREHNNQDETAYVKVSKIHVDNWLKRYVSGIVCNVNLDFEVFYTQDEGYCEDDCSNYEYGGLMGNELKPLYCKICQDYNVSTEYKGNVSLNNHLNNHVFYRPFCCCFCREEFASHDQVERHYFSFHVNDEARHNLEFYVYNSIDLIEDYVSNLIKTDCELQQQISKTEQIRKLSPVRRVVQSDLKFLLSSVENCPVRVNEKFESVDLPKKQIYNGVSRNNYYVFVDSLGEFVKMPVTKKFFENRMQPTVSLERCSNDSSIATTSHTDQNGSSHNAIDNKQESPLRKSIKMKFSTIKDGDKRKFEVKILN